MYIGCASTKRSMLLVASLSSLPSPPFRLRRRRKGAAGYIPPEDASPRRYHSNQPFRYNQSAIALQTTTTTPTFRRRRRQQQQQQPQYADAPQMHRRCTADADNNNNHHNIPHRKQLAYHRQPQPQP